MKKSLLVCALLGIVCQSSFAAIHPMLGALTPPSAPEVGSTLGLLAIGMAGVAAIARKRKQ